MSGARGTAPAVVAASGLVVDVPGRRIADGLELLVRAGESVAVMGPSGAGKTTVLNCLAGLLSPTAGTVDVAGGRISGMNAARAAAHRLVHVGIVFQFGELIPELSVAENVALPAQFARRTGAGDRARELLALVGLEGYEERAPEELSGGETQRVAIARALVCGPALVLADEPTGALDEENGRRVTGVLLNACRATGAALVAATHDVSVAAAMDRRLVLRGGRLVPPQPEGEHNAGSSR